MLRDITAAVDERCGGLLAGVLAPQSGLHSFNLLSNSVLAEVDDALSTSRQGEPQSWARQGQLTQYGLSLVLIFETSPTAEHLQKVSLLAADPFPMTLSSDEASPADIHSAIRT